MRDIRGIVFRESCHFKAEMAGKPPPHDLEPMIPGVERFLVPPSSDPLADHTVALSTYRESIESVVQLCERLDDAKSFEEEDLHTELLDAVSVPIRWCSSACASARFAGGVCNACVGGPYVSTAQGAISLDMEEYGSVSDQKNQGYRS